MKLLPALAAAALLGLLPAAASAQDLPGQRGSAATAETDTRSAGPAAGTTWLMTAFPATAQDRLSVFISRDGHSFTTLASEAYRPPQGLLRDPSVIRDAQGRWVVVYTTGWSGRSFGVARSRDLKHWKHVADIDVALPGPAQVTNVWAPEWFRDSDGSLSVIVSLSSGGMDARGQAQGPFRAWRLVPANADFSAFLAPRPLQGLDRNPIDTFVIRQDSKEGGRYVAFTKNETTKHIERASAAQLEGPWTYEATGDWAGWGNWLEGQALVPVVDAQGRPGWRIFVDEYLAKRVRYSDSFDGLKTWTPLRTVGGVSGAVRHFTVLPESTSALAAATAPRGKPVKIGWDRHSLTLDGRRELFFAGEIHPFRLPSPAHWRDVLQKMKAMGLNTVSIYFSWGYHSAEPGHYDFSGVRNVERLLEMAEEEGLYVIARPGPYVNAELAGGGFPGWLARQRAEARTDAPAYQQAAGEWLAQINAIIARHQITTGGGTVVAYQIENEQFSVQPKNARHMQFLADQARADGITVPLFHNAASRLPDWTPKNSTAPFANPGPTDLYAFDGYPGGVCNVNGEPGRPSPAPDWGLYGTNLPRIGAKASPNTPGFVAEIGGGWFDYWGSNGTYECTARRQGTGFQRVVYGSSLINGLTIHSIYMAFGGTTWGWQAAPVVFTSYDYGAPIDEARRLRPKALGLKQLGHFVRAATPVLAQMDPAEPLQADNPRVALKHNLNAALGTHVVYAVQNPSNATGTESFSFEIPTRHGRTRVPQQGRITLHGQDARLLLAEHALARQQLVYATSELQAALQQGPRDLVLLHGRTGDEGEAVLRFAQRPKLRVIGGTAPTETWNAARGELRLNYRHQGLLELELSGGGTPTLRLLVADEPTSQAFWWAGSGDSEALVLGGALLRRAERAGAELRLVGDTHAGDAALRVWAAPGVERLAFNGQALTATGRDGVLAARAALPGPASVTLPDLPAQAWQRRADSPEAAPGFDDSRWRAADATQTAAHVYTASDTGQPVLAMSDYGFHRGDVWYRGRFQAGAGTPAGSGPLALDLFFGAGGAGLIQVWLDGRFLGQHELATGRPFPETTGNFKLRLPALPPGEHVLAVMVRNMGHNWDLFADDIHKEARGLIAASLSPVAGRRYAVPIAWKLQGQQGGEAIADLVRGPYNNGGLFGERQGWHLPPAPDRDDSTGWQPARPGDAPPAPGTYWLRTDFKLDLPAGHDVQLGLAFGDTTVPRSASEHRVVMFLNGWNVGQFVAHIGPQRVFVLPPGLLQPGGSNRLTLAVTTDGRPENAPETPRLVLLNNARGGVAAETLPLARYLQRPAP